MTTSDHPRTVLITGATSGIGEAAAHSLASDGWRVILAGRNPQRTVDTVNQIKSATGASAVDHILLDLTSFDSVRRGAADFLDRFAQLDVLINNAGLNLSKRTLTPDGLETMMQTNHYSHFLLTSLLLPRLLESADARVVNVSSRAYERAGAMPFEDIHLARRRWSAFGPYGVTKLANILFSTELHRRYFRSADAGGGVASFAVHPGVVATNFGSRMGGPMRALIGAARPFAKNAQEGAEPIVALAHGPHRTRSGAYYDQLKPAKLNKHASDHEAAAKLWDISNDLTDAAWPQP